MTTIKQHINFETKPTCIGTGLVALDVIISYVEKNPTQFLAGGSCGNVLTILSYLGWSSFPIARLNNNVAAELLLEDLKFWKVNSDLLTISENGSTPIIIHRILKDQHGVAKHKFEFKNPEDGKYLPSYKPCLAKSVNSIAEQRSRPNVFYFDRINRASIELAKIYKSQGAIIFFEPSSVKDIKGFDECLKATDVIKFSEDRIPNYEELYPVAGVGLEIQTMSSKGLKFRRKGEGSWTILESYSIDNVIDSAGAGDWCTAGIIMNLFNDENKLQNKSQQEIIRSLQFGQILSALNCTYEGARGLMYDIPNKDNLLRKVVEILSSRAHNIKNYRSTVSQPIKNKSLKISSLFASV